MIFNRFAHASQDRKVRQFSLSSTFVEEFQGKQPAWGPVGYFTYKRTYARPTCECDDPRTCGHPTEEFWQTCQRVVEGVYNVQKIHCRQLGLPWNEPKAQRSAQDMFRRMWEFKFTPPGRGLAQMGAPFMFKKGGAALNNCGFVSSEHIDEDFAGPFTFLMDMSMLGVGVGGDTRGAGKIKLQMPKMSEEPFVVSDDREGWVQLARVSINAFAGKGSFPQVIDFSEVRPKGHRIRGFGGTASGPGPLAKLVKSIVRTLMPEGVEVSFEESFDETGKIIRLETVTQGEGEPYKITSGRITDIYNMVGACVVAGGVRRSAEIMFGHPDDAEFRGLKDDTDLRPLDKRMSELMMSLSMTTDDEASARLQAEIGDLQAKLDAHPLRSHRWASNNSIFGKVGMDYTEVGAAIAKNGEPGILWLDNARRFGRMVDPENNKDRRAMGANPCSEQTLESYELCCLVETYPAHHKDYDDFQRTLKFAYLYAKTVTLMPTHDDRTNAVMIRNRRIGCSMSGIRQAIEKFGRREFLNWCDRGYGYIGELDTIYSEWLGIGPSIKTTSVKPSGCRPWYALTSTNQGLLTLEDLFEHHPADQEWAEQPDRDLEAIGTGIISKTYNNGVAPVLRITTSYGIEVESTPNHQWWVKQEYKRGLRNPCRDVNEWRRADEIQPGDILDIKPGVYNMEGGVELASLNSLAINMRGDATEIRQPERMNPPLAWLLGYLWGDGAMSPLKYRLWWVDAQHENLVKAQSIFKEQFGLDASIKQASEHRKAETLEVGSKHLWHWLIRNEVFKIYADKIDIIPKVVRASGQEEILAFLAGLLDADGCTSRAAEDSVLIWTMADADFARHIQDVALAVGVVVGRSHVTGGGSFQNKRSMFHLTASGHTTARALEILRRHSTKVVKHESRPDFVGWRGEVEGRDGQGLILGKVLKVEPVGNRPTFDVEVYGDFHWYYAGAIKSHNTVSLLCGATPGIHPPHSPFYIRNIRVSEHSPLVAAARAAGHIVEKDAYADATYVISFPVKTDNCSKGKRDVSIWEQAALAADLQRYWADNQVSVTVTFKPEEASEIPIVLEVFEDRLKSISFLPLGDDHGYVQAPYIEITEEEFNAMSARISPMNLSGSKGDQEDKFCDGEACKLSH